MKPSHINDIPALNERGWKYRRDNTYMTTYKKEDLVDVIRCLEHNWAGEIGRCNLLRRRLEKVSNWLEGEGYSLKEINEILSVEGERV